MGRYSGLNAFAEGMVTGNLFYGGLVDRIEDRRQRELENKRTKEDRAIAAKERDRKHSWEDISHAETIKGYGENDKIRAENAEIRKYNDWDRKNKQDNYKENRSWERTKFNNSQTLFKDTLEQNDITRNLTNTNLGIANINLKQKKQEQAQQRYLTYNGKPYKVEYVEDIYDNKYPEPNPALLKVLIEAGRTTEANKMLEDYKNFKNKPTKDEFKNMFELYGFPRTWEPTQLEIYRKKVGGDKSPPPDFSKYQIGRSGATTAGRSGVIKGLGITEKGVKVGSSAKELGITKKDIIGEFKMGRCAFVRGYYYIEKFREELVEETPYNRAHTEKVPYWVKATKSELNKLDKESRESNAETKKKRESNRKIFDALKEIGGEI